MSYTIVVTDLPVGECHTEKHTFLTDIPLVVQKETHTHTHTHQHAYVHNLTQTRTPHTTHTHTIHHTQGLALNLCLMCHRLARKAGADFSDLQRIIFKSWQANTTLRYSKYILIYTIYTKIWAHLQQSTRKVDASYKKQGRKFPACSRLQRGKKEKAD